MDVVNEATVEKRRYIIKTIYIIIRVHSAFSLVDRELCVIKVHTHGRRQLMA